MGGSANPNGITNNPNYRPGMLPGRLNVGVPDMNARGGRNFDWHAQGAGGWMPERGGANMGQPDMGQGPMNQPADNNGNAWGRNFMQQYGQPPGQMREQWDAFRQQNGIGNPQAPQLGGGGPVLQPVSPQMPTLPQQASNGQMPFLGLASPFRRTR